MANAYILSAQIAELMEMVDEETGEFLPGVYEEIEARMKQSDDIFAGIAGYIRNREGDIELRKAEVRRMEAANKRDGTNIESLKKYVADCMKRAGRENIEAGIFKLSLRASTKVIVPVVQNIPIEYQRIKYEVTADKDLIKDYLKDIAARAAAGE